MDTAVAATVGIKIADKPLRHAGPACLFRLADGAEFRIVDAVAGATIAPESAGPSFGDAGPACPLWFTDRSQFWVADTVAGTAVASEIAGPAFRDTGPFTGGRRRCHRQQKRKRKKINES